MIYIYSSKTINSVSLRILMVIFCDNKIFLNNKINEHMYIVICRWLCIVNSSLSHLYIKMLYTYYFYNYLHKRNIRRTYKCKIYTKKSFSFLCNSRCFSIAVTKGRTEEMTTVHYSNKI